MHPTLKIDRLYALEATVDVDEIESYVFLEFMYFVDEKVCFNIGGYYSDILLTVKFAMSFKDCYKNIIYTLLDFSNWIGPDARWLDECDSSSDEDVTIVSKTFKSERTKYWFGDDTYSNCYEISDYISLFTVNYLMEHLKEYDAGKQTLFKTTEGNSNDNE